MVHSYNHALMEWYQRTPGKQVFEIEKSLLKRILQGANGRRFLYWSDQDRYQLLSKMYFEETIYLSLYHDFPLFVRGVQVDPYALPFLSESIDLIFLPQLLEFIPDPFSLLKEICRILKPGGGFLILNFNPVSLWSVSKLINKKDRFPWRGKPMSALFLRCFLARLGLSVVEYKTDFFRPLLSNSHMLEKYSPLETVGQLCWPFLGAIYMMLLRKEGEEFIKIKPTPKPWLSSIDIGRVEPSAHVHSSKS